jgi:hypothetical protein
MSGSLGEGDRPSTVSQLRHCATSRKVVLRDPMRSISLGSRAWLVRRADSVTAMSDPIV